MGIGIFIFTLVGVAANYRLGAARPSDAGVPPARINRPDPILRASTGQRQAWIPVLPNIDLSLVPAPVCIEQTLVQGRDEAA